MLAGKDGLEPFLHQLLPGPGNRGDAGIQGGGDFAVTPTFAGLGGISFQQNARLNQLAGAAFALLDQRVELFTLLVAKDPTGNKGIKLARTTQERNHEISRCDAMSWG